jgi:hypothetical protein
MGLSTLVMWTYSLSAVNYVNVSSFSPHACANPMAAVVDDEEIVLRGELRVQHALVSSQIHASWPMAAICLCLGCNVPSPPHNMLHT